MDKYTDILNTADTFYLGANRCYEQRIIGQNQIEMLIVPTLVNLSFACELYLKALNYKESEDIVKKHELDELYEFLSDKSKKYIREEFKEIDNQHFEQELKKIKLMFIDWRYIFEKNKLEANIDFLYRFARRLKDLANDN